MRVYNFQISKKISCTITNTNVGTEIKLINLINKTGYISYDQLSECIHHLSNIMEDISFRTKLIEFEKDQ